MNVFLQTVDGLGTSWAEVMWRALWQSAVLAAAIYGLAYCLRRQPAALRYWLWMLVPLRLLVMPLVTFPLPVLPAASHPRIPAAAASAGAVWTASETKWSTLDPPDPIAPLLASRTASPLDDLPGDTPDRAPIAAISVSGLVPSLVACLLGLWTVGALFFAVRLARVWMATRHFICTSVAIVDPSILAIVRHVARSIGVTALPRIARTDLNISPLVCGVFRPVIVLPEAALRAAPEELHAILAHEMAHLRRRDPLAGWLLAICELAYFFHPVFHLVRRQILLEREIACDEFVLGAGIAHRATYGQALLTAVSAGVAGESRMPLSVGVAESFRQLQRRLTVICSQMPPQARLSRLAVVLLATLTLLSVPGISLTGRASTTDTETTLPAPPTSQQETSPAAAASQPGRSVIYRGTVFDPAGAPLAGVRVAVEKIGSENPLAQSTTGGDGRFVVGPVPALASPDPRIVTREMVFEHPDYATQWFWSTDLEAGNGSVGIRMTRPATLAGTVRDSNGKPVADAVVEAWLRYWADETHSQLQYLSRANGRALVSDANGAFRFTRLPMGAKMALVVSHGQYARYETIRDPASPPVLSAGEVSVNVSLQEGVPAALQLVRDGQPLQKPGVIVVAMQRPGAEKASSSSWLSLPETLPVQETTDAQGQARLRLAPGRYTFVAIGKELSDLELVCVPGEEVDLAPGQSRRIELSLAKGQVISGRLVDAKTGQGVARQDVRALPQARDVWTWLGWQGVDRDTTDAQGRFRFRLPGGSHRLETQTVYAGVSRTATRAIDVHDAAPPQEIEWAIATVPRIHGRLVDAEGRGVAGSIGIGLETIKTDNGGRFEFDDPMARGTVLVPEAALAVDAAGTRGKALLIRPGQAEEELRIALEPLASVTGRLVARKPKLLILSEDRPASAALPQIEVPLGGSSTLVRPGSWHTSVAADGTLTIRGLPTGTPMKIYFNQADYEELEVPLDGLRPGQTLRLKDIVLRPREGAGNAKGLDVSVAGRVIDQEGHPVARQEVYAYCPGLSGIQSWTDSRGEFEVKELPAKTWVWLHIRREGYGHQSFPVMSGEKNAELKIVPPGYEWYGKSAPALMVSKWFNSRPLTLDDLRGKVVLLCINVAVDKPGTFHDIVQWQNEYGLQGLAVVAVHHRQSDVTGEIRDSEIESFLKANQVTVPVAFDAPKKAAKKMVSSDRLSDCGATYSVYGAKDDGATLYLIDKRGILRCSPTPNNLDEWVRRLLAE